MALLNLYRFLYVIKATQRFSIPSCKSNLILNGVPRFEAYLLALSAIT